MLGIYRTETVIAPKLNWSSYLYGHFVAYIGIAVICAFYIRYLNSEVNTNPYDKDFFELEGGSIYRSAKELLIEKGPKSPSKKSKKRLDANLECSNSYLQATPTNKKIISTNKNDNSRSKRMSMKATTPAQLKRVLKLYHDQ